MNFDIFTIIIITIVMNLPLEVKVNIPNTINLIKLLMLGKCDQKQSKYIFWLKPITIDLSMKFNYDYISFYYELVNMVAKLAKSLCN